MTKKFEIYKCEICGNLIEILEEGAGTLVCCEQPMKLLEVKNDEDSIEKHKPVIEVKDNNVSIKVGKIKHPMLSEHHIDFIEAISLDNKYLYRKYLDINEEPYMNFFCKTDKMKARGLCNIHGLYETINE